MANPSSLILAKKDILAAFSQASQKIYSKTQLASVLRQNRHSWDLADTMNVTDFISFLTKHGDLRANKFRSETYKTEIIRYSWGKASILELAISIKPRAYLCHATAAMLHGLAKPDPKAIYLNVEQSPKLSNNGSLTQEGINRAFSGKQRQSNLIYMCNGASVTMISGKNTNHLGVEERAGPASELLQITNLERTLIDIVVRPAYAGGASHVLDAYRIARNRMSVSKLLAILSKLDYVYPYHQPIGFLMQKAGYPEKSCAKLRELGLNHDFYLAHALRQPEYSTDWRLFYPKDLR
jgi:hypothetical protein